MEHQQLLRDMTAATYPTMKKQRQKELHKSIYKRAYPRTFDSDRKQLKPGQLMGLLNG